MQMQAVAQGYIFEQAASKSKTYHEGITGWYGARVDDESERGVFAEKLAGIGGLLRGFGTFIGAEDRGGAQLLGTAVKGEKYGTPMRRAMTALTKEFTGDDNRINIEGIKEFLQGGDAFRNTDAIAKLL